MKRCIVVLVLFSSCITQKTNDIKCIPTVSNLNEKYKNQLGISAYYADGKVSVLTDVEMMPDSLFGAYYFYNSGTLKSYKFFNSLNNYSYNVEFDSLGKVSNTEGSPIIMRLYRKTDNGSVRVTFLFSTLINEFRKIKIITNINYENEYFDLDPAPLTNIRSLTFDLPFEDSVDDITINTQAEVFEKCTERNSILYDSMLIKRNSF